MITNTPKDDTLRGVLFMATYPHPVRVAGSRMLGCAKGGSDFDFTIEAHANLVNDLTAAGFTDRWGEEMHYRDMNTEAVYELGLCQAIIVRSLDARAMAEEWVHSSIHNPPLDYQDPEVWNLFYDTIYPTPIT